jgi:hypothetical protein
VLKLFDQKELGPGVYPCCTQRKSIQRAANCGPAPCLTQSEITQKGFKKDCIPTGFVGISAHRHKGR